MSDFERGFGTPFESTDTNHKDIMSPPGSLKRTKDQRQISNDEGVFRQPEAGKKSKIAPQSSRGNNFGPSLTSRSDHRQEGFANQDIHGPKQGAEQQARLEAISRDEGQESKMVFLKWAQVFSESESFEAFCPSRLDEFLKEAYQLEKYLKMQKEQLIERLSKLSQTLKLK